MTVVVDASVAFKWFLRTEPLYPQAVAVARDESILIAPDLLVAEVCNAAWRAARMRRMVAEQLDVISAMLPNFFETLVDAASLARRATAIAVDLNHSVYDCFYIALAEVRQIRLVTADERLLCKLEGTEWAALSLALKDYGTA